jgi:hypothetical protein
MTHIRIVVRHVGMDGQPVETLLGFDRGNNHWRNNNSGHPGDNNETSKPSSVETLVEKACQRLLPPDAQRDPSEYGLFLTYMDRSIRVLETSELVSDDICEILPLKRCNGSVLKKEEVISMSHTQSLLLSKHVLASIAQAQAAASANVVKKGDDDDHSPQSQTQPALITPTGNPKSILKSLPSPASTPTGDHPAPDIAAEAVTMPNLVLATKPKKSSTASKAPMKKILTKKRDNNPKEAPSVKTLAKKKKSSLSQDIPTESSSKKKSKSQTAAAASTTPAKKKKLKSLGDTAAASKVIKKKTVPVKVAKKIISKPTSSLGTKSSIATIAAKQSGSASEGKAASTSVSKPVAQRLKCVKKATSATVVESVRKLNTTERKKPIKKTLTAGVKSATKAYSSVGAASAKKVVDTDTTAATFQPRPKRAARAREVSFQWCDDEGFGASNANVALKKRYPVGTKVAVEAYGGAYYEAVVQSHWNDEEFLSELTEQHQKGEWIDLLYVCGKDEKGKRRRHSMDMTKQPHFVVAKPRGKHEEDVILLSTDQDAVPAKPSGKVYAQGDRILVPFEGVPFEAMIKKIRRVRGKPWHQFAFIRYDETGEEHWQDLLARDDISIATTSLGKAASPSMSTSVNIEVKAADQPKGSVCNKRKALWSAQGRDRKCLWDSDDEDEDIFCEQLKKYY